MGEPGAVVAVRQAEQASEGARSPACREQGPLGRGPWGGSVVGALRVRPLHHLRLT